VVASSRQTTNRSLRFVALLFLGCLILVGLLNTWNCCLFAYNIEDRVTVFCPLIHHAAISTSPLMQLIFLSLVTWGLKPSSALCLSTRHVLVPKLNSLRGTEPVRRCCWLPGAVASLWKTLVEASLPFSAETEWNQLPVRYYCCLR
jgi:hypothetical protein